MNILFNNLQFKRKIYIVTELVNGGDLLDFILRSPEKKLSENVTKFIMYQVYNSNRNI